MPDDLDRLETLAKAATPGPWTSGLVGVYQGTENGEWSGDYVVHSDGEGLPNITDRLFIAAAAPQAVLALVAELRAAREVVEEARAWSLPANAEIMPYAAQRDFRELVAAYDEARHADR